MDDINRLKLLGTYQTPLVQYGENVFCEARGELVVVGLHEAPIPWPMGRGGSRGQVSLVLFGDLLKAVHQESVQAVAYWWDVATTTVWRWRKVRGVERENHGTLRLRREYAKEPLYVASREKAVAKAQDPERNRRIASALRGRPWTEERRRKLSETHRRLGIRPVGRVWEVWEEALLGVLPDEEVVRRTGRSINAVRIRRGLLNTPRPPWLPAG
jgi:hypothetical protein